MIMHEHMGYLYFEQSFLSPAFFFFNFFFVSGMWAKIQGETPFISAYIASQLLFHKSR